jgi:hypothetical protein
MRLAVSSAAYRSTSMSVALAIQQGHSNRKIVGFMKAANNQRPAELWTNFTKSSGLEKSGSREPACASYAQSAVLRSTSESLPLLGIFAALQAVGECSAGRCWRRECD